MVFSRSTVAAVSAGAGRSTDSYRCVRSQNWPTVDDAPDGQYVQRHGVDHLLAALVAAQSVRGNGPKQCFLHELTLCIFAMINIASKVVCAWTSPTFN